MKLLKVFAAVLSSALLTACSAEDSFMEESMVLEGWIMSGGYPTVLLTSSVVPGNEGNLSEKVLPHAKVTISDGSREVVMTASPSPGMLPPFRYYTFKMVGEPGKTYTVRAKYKNMRAEATAYMCEPTPIESVRVLPSDNDTLRRVMVDIVVPDSVPAYYWLSVNTPEAGKIMQPMPCFLGTFCERSPGEKVSFELLKPKKKLKGEKYDGLFTVGETVTVMVNRVEEGVFNFWRDFNEMTAFTSSPFISSDQSLPTNVKGGLGIWSVCGTSKRTILIE